MVCNTDLGDIGQKHRNLIPPVHSEVLECPRKAVYQPLQFPVGDLFPHINICNGIRPVLCRPAQGLGHSDFLNVYFIGDTIRIRFVP